MKNCLFHLILLILTSASAYGQVAKDFVINAPAADRGGLVGNGITDLKWVDGTLYVGTGFGLSASSDGGDSWTSYTPDDYGGRGGVSALDVGADGTIWMATAYDTTLDEGDLSVGGGIRFLEPGSEEWGFIPQPVDARSDTANGKSPTTTRVQNVSFDLAVRGSDELWISSFGGGVRRSTDRGENWEVITTDGLPFGSLANLNHRGFAALVDTSEHIWIGTVGGISKSTDGGQNWERFTHLNQEAPISGNWVIGLFNNPADNSVWATTLRATGETEFNAISATFNGGVSWELFLVDELADGTFPRYIAFHEQTVYVATEKGVYKSADNGASWFLFPAIRDALTGEGLFTSTFYSVAAEPLPNGEHRLWVGSVDGLASSSTNGYDWTVYRSFISTRERTDPAVYAYPNPFSPLHSDRPCRFQFDISEATEVSIDIFNFAMERVTTLTSSQSAPSFNSFDRAVVWDGKDSNGRLVDNGVYFFRAKVLNAVTWGKIVIIN
ncbi:MAG: hypothetical protein KDI38_10470 [Calditrichaeota bacterium]|nr:hypothetical protein [Calditrichota bacterium]